MTGEIPVEYDANSPHCVECGVSFGRAIRAQGGGSHKIYCSAKCRSNSWARGNTEKRKLSVIKYDRKPASKEAKQIRSRHARFAKYGTTEEFITDLLTKQEGTCAGCLIALDLNNARIDHCHKIQHESGEIKIRGLLCDHCNWALGHAKDDPAVLERLARYLNG